MFGRKGISEDYRLGRRIAQLGVKRSSAAELISSYMHYDGIADHLAFLGGAFDELLNPLQRRSGNYVPAGIIQDIFDVAHMPYALPEGSLTSTQNAQDIFRKPLVEVVNFLIGKEATYENLFEVTGKHDYLGVPRNELDDELHALVIGNALLHAPNIMYTRSAQGELHELLDAARQNFAVISPDSAWRAGYGQDKWLGAHGGHRNNHQPDDSTLCELAAEPYASTDPLGALKNWLPAVNGNATVGNLVLKAIDAWKEQALASEPKKLEAEIKQLWDLADTFSSNPHWDLMRAVADVALHHGSLESAKMIYAKVDRFTPPDVNVKVADYVVSHDPVWVLDYNYSRHGLYSAGAIDQIKNHPALLENVSPPSEALLSAAKTDPDLARLCLERLPFSNIVSVSDSHDPSAYYSRIRRTLAEVVGDPQLKRQVARDTMKDSYIEAFRIGANLEDDQLTRLAATGIRAYVSDLSVVAKLRKDMEKGGYDSAAKALFEIELDLTSGGMTPALKRAGAKLQLAFGH